MLRRLVVGQDNEWTNQKIDVLGLAWETPEGMVATATDRTDQTLEDLLRVLGKADVIVGHNHLDADVMQMQKEGINTEWASKVFDTRIGLHAAFGHLAGTGSYDLRSMVLLLNGRKGERFSLDWKQYESDLHKTCAFDSAAALWCYPTLQRLIESKHLQKTVDIGHRVSPIFAQMRERGVRLDKKALESIHNERKKKLESTIERFGLYELRGKKVIKRVPIWRSPKVLDKFESLFGVRPANLQRATWNKLASQASLSGDAREFAGAIVELTKGANDAHWLGEVKEDEDKVTFGKVGEDGFIHPRYDLCGSPDRAIASGPNIQNFPRPSDDPRPVPLRSAVVGLEPDHCILGVDFSSVETITNAIESRDMDRAIAALQKRISHEGTAALVNRAMGLELNRQQGKAINHGFDKGESPYNLARTLFKTERPSRQQVLQCQQIFQQMLKEYPATARFRDELWERSVENPLVVTNSFGRQLSCFSRSKYGDANERMARHDPTKKYWCPCAACAPRRDRWKYAIAFLGRSSAFDALLRKLAVISYDRRLGEFSLPLIEVHDELDFSVPEQWVKELAVEAKRAFEEPIEELGVSLPADVKYGINWAEAH